MYKYKFHNSIANIEFSTQVGENTALFSLK